MRLARLLVAVLALVATPAFADGDVELVLETSSRVVTTGDTFFVTAALRGPAVDALVAATDPAASAVAARPEPPSLRRTFRVVAGAPGTQSVGPFELVAFGRTLRSNVLAVEVRPQPRADVALVASKPRVRVGERFELTVESSTSQALELRPSDAYGVASTATSFESKTTNGATKVTRKSTYTLVPRVARRLVFDARSFASVPANLAVARVAVEVRGR